MFQIHSANRYISTPDSSGLRGLPKWTPLQSDLSLPIGPTSPSDILNCAAPVHLRTILIYGLPFHNHYSTWNSFSPHGALPAHTNITLTRTSAYIFQQVRITHFNRLTPKHVRLLQERTQDSPTASCHHWRPPPVKAVITNGNPRDSLANPEPLSTNCFVYNIYPLS